MIRDRIVVGLHDVGLSEKLQTDPELTLDKAITMARQTEAVRGQQPVVRGNMDNCTQELMQWIMVTPAKSKLLRTIQQRNKQNLVLISQLPNPARKDAPDAASFQHIHVISAQLVKPSATSVESKVTISQYVDQPQPWQQYKQR